jgi:hypothetical protein
MLELLVDATLPDDEAVLEGRGASCSRIWMRKRIV